MSNLTFNVCKRENNENKVNLRRVGLTPGIIYGEFLKNPIPIKIDSSDLKRLLKTNNKGSIIPICLGKKKLNCVVKDLQKNYRNEIIHVDFQYTKPNERIKMKIPIKFSGQENLESKRLVLETHITSIELDDVRHEMAKYYINQSDYADTITLLKGDASQVLTELTGEYDLVFLDGPKGQYLKQLELILPHVKEGGVILADNVLFRGYVRGDKEPPKRFKTIVKRLKEYLTYVENKELFNTTIYPMGDGMSVSVWKGHNK